MLMPIVRFLGLLGLCVAAGCNRSGPPLTPVSGTVTLDNKPFAEAQVRFLPQGDTLGHGGAGITDADGKYEIIAHRTNNRKGLLPGEYKVVVTRLRMPDGSPVPPGVPPVTRDTPLAVTIGTDAKTFDVSLKK